MSHAVICIYSVVQELLQWDRFRVCINYRVLAPRAAFKAKYVIRKNDCIGSVFFLFFLLLVNLSCQTLRRVQLLAMLPYIAVCITTCRHLFRENEGHTPLVIASLKGHRNVVKLLLKEGAKVDPHDLWDAIKEGKE